MALPMVPVGTNSAASLPAISAARLFQPVDGGVFAVNVVADFGFHHGAPHGGGGLGDGVAAQVDHAVRNSWKTSLESITPRLVRRSAPPRFPAARRRRSGGWAGRSAPIPRLVGRMPSHQPQADEEAPSPGSAGAWTGARGGRCNPQSIRDSAGARGHRRNGRRRRSPRRAQASNISDCGAIRSRGARNSRSRNARCPCAASRSTAIS